MKDPYAELVYSMHGVVFELFKYPSLTLRQCQLRAKRILRDPWFKENYPGIFDVKVGFDDSVTFSYCLPSRIKGSRNPVKKRLFISLHPEHRNLPDLLHEFAHGVVRFNNTSHSKQFLNAFEELIHHYCGEEPYYLFHNLRTEYANV